MLFNSQNLFHYVLAMKDKNILKISSKYCFDVLAAFDLLYRIVLQSTHPCNNSIVLLLLCNVVSLICILLYLFLVICWN